MKKNTRQSGMSLIEVMIVLLMTSIITGAIFTQITQVQRRAGTEQVKLDLFQETRDFMDQISRDLHQAGYPSPRNYGPDQLPLGTSDAKAAVGLVKVGYNELRFEGDVDGTGTVSSLIYQLVTTGDGCPCLRRSQQNKIGQDPMNQGSPTWYTEVQNVQNGTSATDGIFFAFTGGGTPIDLTSPVTWDTTNTAAMQTLASIDTIKVVLTTQANHPDLQTGLRPSSTLVSTIRLNNCSQAAYGKPMSCQ